MKIIEEYSLVNDSQNMYLSKLMHFVGHNKDIFFAEYLIYFAFRVFTLQCLPIDTFAIFVSRGNALDFSHPVCCLFDSHFKTSKDFV